MSLSLSVNCLAYINGNNTNLGETTLLLSGTALSFLNIFLTTNINTKYVPHH